jgi:hypothetical protein
MALIDEPLERALGYPYAIPERSFALKDGRILAPGAVEVDLSARVAVLAYGSNASPAVLGRKLAGSTDPVPVLRAVLSDLDVVYSAHISPYGAVPATLRRSPGTEAAAFVAQLTDEQVRLISETEPNYRLTSLEAASCELEDGSTPALSAYLSRHGCLLHESTEIAVAGIAARGRSFPAMSQRQVLELVRSLVCPERSLQSFVAAAAADPKLAGRWTQTLAKRRRAKRASTP